MKSKKRLLRDSNLYAIIDKKICGRRSLLSIVSKIKGGGPDIVQFRDKESQKETTLKYASALGKALSRSKTIYIINDYLDLAKIVDSDGIHLGQDDLPVEIARRILGKDKIIGLSCHNLKQAIEAQAKGVDYLSLGPVFATPTKPQSKPVGLDLIKRVRKKIKIPFFVIGGINQNNISQVLSYGAKRVALCSTICQAKNITLTIKNLKKQLDNYY